MMGKKQNKQVNSFSKDFSTLSNELNQFYARFDIRDCNEEWLSLCQNLLPDQIEISHTDVELSFLKLKSKKAAGPDRITGRVLKNCAWQLSPIFTYIFQILLNRRVVSLCVEDFHNVPYQFQ